MSSEADGGHPPFSGSSLADLSRVVERAGGRLSASGGQDSASVLVSGVTLDSRQVEAGDLYAALPGAHGHGADYWPQARAAGAVAVLTDAAGAEQIAAGGPVPTLLVPEVRPVLGPVAAFVYGNPASRLRTIGVTGTQGKTTSTRLLEGGLTGAGLRAAVIGTVGTRILGAEVASSLTTPEAPELQRLLQQMVEAGVEVCAMEVSSHALVMGRVGGFAFDVAVFLNLGRDHLDFHRDVDDYFAAKASLFTPEHARQGLVNIDGDWGRRLLDRAGVPMTTMSTTGAGADWQATDIVLRDQGAEFRVVGPGVDVGAGCPIPGAFNVANTLAAVVAAALAGYDPAEVATAVRRGPGVPGRLERIDEGQEFEVVIDYAHKPDAVAAALEALRPVTQGRLLVVLGAGGDRDAGKRPLMGAIAAAGADLLVVTDDNPRSEDPATIRAAILAGTRTGSAEVVEIGDRRLAIAEAIGRARPGDVVLIAGKGHETGQEVAGVVHPFDDRSVAREELRR